MTDSISNAAPGSQDADFNATGRTVAAGRGWDWIVEAFALFRKQPGMWILAAVVLAVLCALISMIPFLGSIANTLLLPIFAAGLMLGCQTLDQGGTLELAHLFAGFKRRTGDLVLVGVFNLICWAVIALAVVAVIGGGVVMGMLRGGVPGAGISILSMLIAMLLAAGLSVPLCMATWFAPALIVLNDLAPAAALKASYFACVRNWIPFLVYSLVLMVLGLIVAIPAGVVYLIFVPVFGMIAAIPASLVYLVLVPVLAASVYAAYRDIFCAG